MAANSLVQRASARQNQLTLPYQYSVKVKYMIVNTASTTAAVSGLNMATSNAANAQQEPISILVVLAGWVLGLGLIWFMNWIDSQ